MEFKLSQKIGLFLGPIAAIILCILPGGIPGLAPIGVKALALTLWMVIWWVTSALPIWVTALLPIAGSIVLNLAGMEVTEEGVNAYGSYAAPVTMMCLGVFVLGAVIEKWNLHRRIALSIINMVGGRPSMIVFGFGLATAVISMFMSNTTAVAMLLPIAIALISQLGMTKKDGFSVALILVVAYAASIGGMATLIGSGTNLSAVGLIKELTGISMSFTDWLIIGLPFTIVLLPLATLLICKMFKVGQTDLGDTKVIREELKALGKMSKGEKISTVYLLVAILGFAINDQVAKLLPFISNEGFAIVLLVASFVIPVNWKKGEFLMDSKTALEKTSWSTFILLGGALTLGGIFKNAGIAAWIAEGLGFLASWPPILVILFLCVVVAILTEVVSNFVVVAAFLPAISGLAVTIGMNPMFLMMAVSLSASFAFMLPTGTPPNALVFGSGYIEMKDLMKGGFVVKVLGIVIFPVIMYAVAAPLSPLF